MKLVSLAILATSTFAFADRAREPSQPAGVIAPVPLRPPPPPPPPPQPKVPSEVEKLAKTVAGTYKCKGVAMRGDGSSTPLVATITIKLDLDKAWLQTALVEEKPGGLRFTDYRTYDPIAKQWTRIELVNTAGYIEAKSLGEQNGAWMWEGSAIGPGGTLQTRDHEERDANQMKLWGEAMLGGSWQKLYEVTCRK